VLPHTAEISAINPKITAGRGLALLASGMPAAL
jgi:hypothetical protein